MKYLTLAILASVFFTCIIYGETDRYLNKIHNDPKFEGTDETYGYDVKFYGIDLEVSDSSTYLQGSTSVLIELAETVPETLKLDLANSMHVDSVLLNKLMVDYEHHNEQLFIHNAIPSNAGNLFMIQVFYHGMGGRANQFAGVFNSEDRRWQTRVTWTMSEPFSARNWFPCKQDLDDKADSVYVFITTHKSLLAGSNGLLVNQQVCPDDKIRYEWKSHYPIAYYLISFAVSDYRDYSVYARSTSQNDSILIQNYLYDHDEFLEGNRKRIDITADLLELYSELFGPYPFKDEKYGHCIVPSGGGMEHQTMTTLEDFSFTLVGHELAHQWFGNYVTCATWQDIWINEGFASYAEYLACQYLISQDEAARWMRNAHNIIKHRIDGSIYIPLKRIQDENRIFDYRLSYKKGAAMIHMIRHEINNDSIFFGVLKDFLASNQHGNATGMDFKHLLEHKTKMDFTAFFDQWFFGEGYPLVTIHWHQNGDTLMISSSQRSLSSTPVFNILIDFKITTSGKDTLISLRQNSEHEEWKLYMPDEVIHIQADPNNWLLFELEGTYKTISGESEEDSSVHDKQNNYISVKTVRD